MDVFTDFKERSFYLTGRAAIEALGKTLNNLPLSVLTPLKVTISPHKKIRSHEQNALMWAARLADISEQAWVHGKQFSPAVWHSHLKQMHLPEQGCENFEKMVTKRYKKWEEMPDGSLTCVGSTTQLTTYGFSIYLEKCDAFAVTELGVRFTTRRVDDYYAT